MSKDKQKYLEAYVPESVPKETPKRSGLKSDGRTKEIEDAIAAFNELLAKQNRDNLDAMYNIDMGNMSSSMRRLFQSYDDGITKANASIETWANAQEAGFKAIAEWQGETTKSISLIGGKADANAASITLLNQWKGTTSSSLAAVQTKADQNKADITLLTNWKSTANSEISGLKSTTASIKATADSARAKISQVVEAIGENGEVSFASIAAGVSNDDSFIELIADKVHITSDMLVLDSDVYLTGKNDDGNEMMRISGNNISLNMETADAAGITFWYSGIDDYLVAGISASRDGDMTTSQGKHDRRYAVNLHTFETVEDYYTALNLDALGELYMNSGTRVSIQGLYGVRIYPNLDMFTIQNSDYEVSRNDLRGAYCYVFASDGIYWVNSSGEYSLVAAASNQ